ncbi:MAG TPA: hypothetical protein VK195_16650 [Burkholderiaceae bacterium]|nr:hypothetical protein [Burkholderiaceae bacterium]
MSHSPLRRLVSAACLSLALAPALAQADDATITVNLVPLANSHHQHDVRMKFVTDMAIKPREGASAEEVQALTTKMGAIKMPLTMMMQLRQHLQTGKADAQGRIPLIARIEQGTMDMRTGDGDLLPGVPNRGMPEMQFNADIVDGRYENIRLSGEGAAKLPPALLEGVFRKTFDALGKMNGSHLRVGDSLDLPLEMNLPIPGLPGGSNAGKVTARYTLTKVEAGVAFFDIGASLDFKLDLPMPAAQAASAASAPADAEPPKPSPVQMVMTGGGTGHMQWRLADRLQLHNDMEMQMAMQMPLPEGHAMQMNLQMQMDSDGKALPAVKGKGKAAPASAKATKSTSAAKAATAPK